MNFDYQQFYFSAEGRVNRQQWWLRLILPILVIMLVLHLIDSILGTYDAELKVGILTGIFSLFTVIPGIIVYIKRFHDRDKSGWWVLIGIIPILGALWLLIELGFLAGTPGSNRYGPPVEDEPVT
jgi:uncharacterized membrane protein YhaH (DUF805 family)